MMLMNFCSCKVQNRIPNKKSSNTLEILEQEVCESVMQSKNILKKELKYFVAKANYQQNVPYLFTE